LQDLADAKTITLELLENLAVLSKTFLQQAAENHFDVPNREAITHLVRRAEVLLRASGETADVVLDGRPRNKLTPYLWGGYPHPSLTETAKRVCKTLRLTPLIPAHRTKVAATKTRVSATLSSDHAVKGDLRPSFLLLSCLRGRRLGSLPGPRGQRESSCYVSSEQG